MIHNNPVNFLSLHENIQYYNTHKNQCYLDKDLRVISKEDTPPDNSNIASEAEVPVLIFQKIQEFYTGDARDNKWLELIKKDIKQLTYPKETKVDNLLFSKVQNVVNQISSLEKTIQHPRPVDWLSQGIVNVVSLFDQDAEDANGAVRNHVYDALSAPDNILIVPKTIFTAGLEVKLLRWMSEVDLFEQKNSGFVVIIPKSLLREDSPEKSLSSLGLEADQLSPSTIHDVFHNFKNEKATLDQWEALWSISSPLKKRWYFNGHGSSEGENQSLTIAGLKEKPFSHLTQFIKQQNTEIAIFDTCHGGRTLPEVKNQFFAEGKFPVLSWSRVDTPTASDHLDLHLLWSGIHDYLKNSSHGQKATDSLRSLMNTMSILPEFMKSYLSDYEKQPLILPAYSGSPPTGFKPAQSKYTKNVLPIGQIELRKAQLNPQEGVAIIEVPKDINKVEISTPYLDIQLKVNSDTYLQSMIPGNAQHYIDHLTIKDGNTNKYFENLTREYHKNPDRRSSSNNGFFIQQLTTASTFRDIWQVDKSKDITKLKDITVLLTPGGEMVVAFYDQNSKTYQQLQFTECEAEEGLYTRAEQKQISAEEYREISIKALIATFPQEEAVYFSTGGQGDRMAVFDQVFKQVFSANTPEEIAPLYFIARKILLNENPSSWVIEISALPEQFQSLAIQMVLTKSKEPSFYKEFCLEGLIHAKNWQKYIDILPDEKKKDVYPVLIQKGILGKTDIEAILNKQAIPIIGKVYPANTLVYRGLLALINLNTNFEQAMETMEVCKKYCVKGLLKSKDFPAMKKAMLSALAKSQNPAETFKDFILLAIRQGLTEGLEWVLAYYQEHPMFPKDDLIKFVNEGINEVYFGIGRESLSEEDAIAFSELIANCRSKVGPYFDKLDIGKTLSSDRSLILAKTILSDSFAKAQSPELRSYIIQQLKDNHYQYSDPTEFLFHLDAVFNLTKDEKVNLINTFILTIAGAGNVSNLQRLFTWIPGLNLTEEQKQDFLGFTFAHSLNGKNPNEMASALLNMGLNTEDPKFIDILTLALNISSNSFPFIYDHFKDKLDKIGENIFINFLSPTTFGRRVILNIKLLEYMVKERGISIPSKMMNNLVGEMLEYMNLHRNSIDRDPHFGNAFELLERKCELLADHGMNLEYMGRKEELINLVSKLIADSCHLSLIKSVLNGIKLSKNEHDNILLVAARKGRIDILEWLMNEGCKYKPDIIQRALFSSPSSKRTEMEGLLLKMSE